jgi:hypothetical protein
LSPLKSTEPFFSSLSKSVHSMAAN